jgi:hypothetical protein
MVAKGDYTDQTTLNKVIGLISQLEKDLWDKLGDCDNSEEEAKKKYDETMVTLQKLIDDANEENGVLDGELDGLETNLSDG